MAVLLTGQLRVRDKEHFKAILQALSGTSVIVVTTEAYAALADYLVKAVGGASDFCVVNELERVPEWAPNASVVNTGWINSHRDLDIALRAFEYVQGLDVVIRGRSDIMLRSAYDNQYLRYRDLVSTHDVLQAASDLVFYSSGKTFSLAFRDFYSHLVHTYSRPPPLRKGDTPVCRQNDQKGNPNIYSRYIVDTGCPCLGDRKRWDGRHLPINYSEAPYFARPEAIFSYHVQSQHHLTCAPLCTRTLLQNSRYMSRCPYTSRVEAIPLGNRRSRRAFSFHKAVSIRAKELAPTQEAQFQFKRCDDLLSSSLA